MQQQWHDLVMAEQQNEPLEVLEQMYDTYILLAEEYNRSSEAYSQEQQTLEKATAKRKNKKKTFDGKSVKLAS
jgi:hypothetical protein